MHDAKAHLSELVRLTKSKGPQHITVHDRDEVVVIAADQFQPARSGLTGRAIIEAFQACPYPDDLILPSSYPTGPVREVEL